MLIVEGRADIKPCSCGGEAFLYCGDYFYVECEDCTSRTDEYCEDYEAIRAWNDGEVK